jgi:hypothetical protein
MADTKITGLDVFSGAIAAADRLVIVDASDTGGTAGGAGGTDKQMDPQLLRNMLIEPNFLINGGGDYFQRQDPATLTSKSDDVYAGDRWYVLTQTAAIQTQRTTGDTQSKYAHRLKQNQAGAQRMGYAQIVESVSAIPLRGRAVRAQARVNISNSQAVHIAILEWTGTADSPTSDVVNDWTSGTYTTSNFFIATTTTVVAVATVTPGAATWTDISVTGTVSSSANNLIVFIWTTGTAAQNVTLDITEAGLYDGTAARSWLPRPTMQELDLCQRYYEKTYDIDTVPGSGGAVAGFYYFLFQQYGVYSAGVGVTWKVSKRTAPTVTVYDGSGVSGQITLISGADVAPTGVDSNGSNGFRVYYTGAGNNQGILFHATGSAEL